MIRTPPPGDATTRPAGQVPRRRRRLPAYVMSGVAALAALVLNAATGLAALGLLLLLAPLSAGAVLVPAIGTGPLARVLTLVHRLAAFQRRWASRVLREDNPPDTPPARRRELRWLAVHSVAGPAPPVVEFALLAAYDYVYYRLRPMDTSVLNTFSLSTAVLAIALLIIVSILLLRTGQARLTRALLDPPAAPDARIRELTESRASVVDARAAELRRIERDLHDGAQAKLIAIRMSLGLARGCPDPDERQRMIDEAREIAAQALTDLRDLVRGIHPPVLSDRGLAGAIEASALLCPMPVELDLDLPGRLQPPVESAVYFAAAEALTNVTKHSGASRAWVRLRHSADRLRLTVGDDGGGGARDDGGTGLRGIHDRLTAFDGSLTVSSPRGGPTELTMELPCALSSPKI